MGDIMHLKLGHIDYLNCVPLFHYLHECGFDGTIVNGVPAQLNQQLAEGQLDVSPSSSFEYGRNYQQYLLLPGHSISAFDKVNSVFLFSPVPIKALDGRAIYVTAESDTSVNLLRVLLREYLGFETVDCRVPSQPVEDLLAQGQAVLLIGDRAMKMDRTNAVPYRYDLAQLWNQHTRLPFVFALWIVHRHSCQQKLAALRQLQQQLLKSRQKAFSQLETLALATTGRPWIDIETLIAYWQSLSYTFEAPHLAGLNLFFELCVKYGYLTEQPNICWLPDCNP